MAILLTGGADGEKACRLSLKPAGTRSSQDEKTSVVYGMPAAAVELGGASEILPLNSIAESIAKKITNRKGKPS